jgi:hypothetical protein
MEHAMTQIILPKQRGIGVALLAMLCLGAAAPDGQPFQALQKIELGLWDIKAKDVRDGSKTMCITDPAVLLQLAHPGLACKRFPISNAQTEATVHYSCAGAGSGQTSIRVETARLVQIDTQGLVSQRPFQMKFEGRRIGNCLTAR